MGLSMAAFNFLKHPYIVICGFFLYITGMAHFFNANFSEHTPMHDIDFLFHLEASLVCLLFLLPSVFLSKSDQKPQKPVENKIYFYLRRFCSGFFFAWGGCYFVISIVLTQAFIKFYKGPDITWPQITLLSILTLSVLFLSAYFLPKKVRLFSFLGSILFLVGFTFFLFPVFGENITEKWMWDLSTSRNIFNLKGWPDLLYYTLFFGFFWLLTIKINQLDSCYFKSSVHLWFNTLLFNGLISFLTLPLFTGDFYSCYEYIKQDFATDVCVGYFLFGFFLWFCIKAFCFFESENKPCNVSSFVLNGWFFSVLTILGFMLIYDKHNVSFLLSSVFMVIGIYFFWKSDPLVFFKTKFTKSKQNVLLLLLSLILIRMFLLVFYLSMLGGYVISILIQRRFPFDCLNYINDNGIVFSLPAAFLLFVYLHKNNSFEKNVTILLNYIFACIASFFAVNLLKEYINDLFMYPTSIFWGGYPQLSEITEQIFWVQEIEVVLCLLLVYLSFKQGTKSGKRLILWTILSNLILYAAFSEIIFTLLVHIHILLAMTPDLHSWALGNIQMYSMISKVVTSLLSVFMLCFPVFIFRNMKLEEKVLPALLRCRLPRASEKQKMEEALTILKEKSFLSDTSTIQILISQISEANAYTINNETIAITHRLFQRLTSQQIAGILSHEFGHIEHNDGRLRLFLYILNLPITLIKKLLNPFSNDRSISTNIICFFCLFFFIYTNGLSDLTSGISGIVIWFLLQTAIFLMENQDLQDSEWMADEYAASKGLGQELKEALTLMATVDETNDDNDREPWMEKYPDLAERIQRLETLQNPIGA